MIRTIASIIITFAIIFGLSFYEIHYVQETFTCFEETLESLHQKTESGVATYEDGTAVRKYWEDKKYKLHVWVPHTALQEIDYQLNEAIGFLYVKDYAGALPKIEVVIGLSRHIPHSYALNLGNIF